MERKAVKLNNLLNYGLRICRCDYECKVVTYLVSLAGGWACWWFLVSFNNIDMSSHRTDAYGCIWSSLHTALIILNHTTRITGYKSASLFSRSAYPCFSFPLLELSPQLPCPNSRKRTSEARWSNMSFLGSSSCSSDVPVGGSDAKDSSLKCRPMCRERCFAGLMSFRHNGHSPDPKRFLNSTSWAVNSCLDHSRLDLNVVAASEHFPTVQI